jgi:hypothetical protein
MSSLSFLYGGIFFIHLRNFFRRTLIFFQSILFEVKAFALIRTQETSFLSPHLFSADPDFPELLILPGK